MKYLTVWMHNEQALSISSLGVAIPILSRRIKLRNMSRGIKNNWSDLSPSHERARPIGLAEFLRNESAMYDLRGYQIRSV